MQYNQHSLFIYYIDRTNRGACHPEKLLLGYFHIFWRGESKLIMVLIRFVDKLVSMSKWISMMALLSLVLFVTIGILSRAFGNGIMGDIEIVRSLVVIIVSFSFAYVQKEKGHLNVDILLTKVNPTTQKVIEIASLFIGFLVNLTLGIVMLKYSKFYMLEFKASTEILSIPQYPLTFAIGLGLIIWSLTSLAQGIVKFGKG